MIELKQPKKLQSHKLFFIPLLLLLALGIFFRFDTIDQQPYWIDESFTSLRISGYTRAELIEQSFKGREIGVEDLQKFQRPSSEKSFVDTIVGLAREEPQLPPLYFVMARFWAEAFGSLGSPMAIARSLSAFLSLLVFPCIYWLCLELFKSSLVGQIAVAFVAVSPLYTRDAQEARYYVLWSILTLVSSTFFLKAIRINTRFSWLIYAVSLIASLYTFTLTLLTMLSHGVYFLLTEGLSWSRKSAFYLAASTISLLIFLPWLLTIVMNLSTVRQMTNWANEQRSVLVILKDLANFTTVSLIGFTNKFFIAFVISLIAYSLYFLCIKKNRKIWLFIATLVLVPAITFILPDIINGTSRSIATRYLMPCYLGIQITLSYLFYRKIFVRSSLGKYIWRVCLVFIILCGITFLGINSQADVKRQIGFNAPIARIVNLATSPLIISDLSDFASPARLAGLSHLLKPQVRLLLFATVPHQIDIPKHYSNIFIFSDSQAIRKSLTPGYQIKMLLENKSLWLVQKR
ncbi:hypothetical protein TUMEXPCC7403_16830 [Tumidithrix helvetica PCC 7403]|uniref:glycosyltransferase family 39 protein n=1 Tax=Tumidithrix helvetica TaxID=3457545 RepID=UPI003CC3BBBF